MIDYLQNPKNPLIRPFDRPTLYMNHSRINLAYWQIKNILQSAPDVDRIQSSNACTFVYLFLNRGVSRADIFSNLKTAG